MLNSSYILPKELQQDLKKIKQEIANQCHSEHPSINSILEHVAVGSGKKLRALLVLLLTKVCGNCDINLYTTVAVAIEMIHTSTLLHDDVLDDALTRRGEPALRAKYGSKSSILAGDLLYTKSFSSITNLEIHALNKTFATTTADLVSGELLQASLTWQSDDLEANYYKVIAHKTASLFALCGQSAAIITKQTDAVISKLEQYVHLLGMAFQIIDDVLDFSASSVLLGKKSGSDFFEGKVTLPLLYIYPKLAKAEQQMIHNPDKKGYEIIRKAVNEKGGIAYATQQAGNYCNQAQTLLEQEILPKLQQNQTNTKTENNSTKKYIDLLQKIPKVILQRTK